MSYSFGKTSRERLDTCHPLIIKVMEAAIKVTPVDFLVICGHRGEKEQNAAFESGASKAKFPWSRHNSSPSEAVDVGPYDITVEGRIPWLDEGLLLQEYVRRVKLWYELAGVIHGTAMSMGIPLEWGGRWKSIIDLPHWQLRKEFGP